MSDYSSKLLALASKKQKILQEETQLISKRKSEIAELAERFNLLTISDTAFAGMFHELQHSLEVNTDKVKELEKIGENFLRPRPTKNTPQIKSHDKESAETF
jgi:hypothetical protein